MNNIVSVFRGSQGSMVKNAMAAFEQEVKKQEMSLLKKNYWVNQYGEEDELSGPLIIFGLSGETLVSRVLIENGYEPPLKAESLAIHSCRVDGNKTALVVSGADECGLMYAIYEVTDMLRYGDEALFGGSSIHIEEAPENRVRGVDRYIMNHNDEEWFYSEEFWDYFLKMLARNRFNRFTMITGFDTSYMTPPYPFFVEVPGFEKVSVKNLTKEGRDYNLNRLNLIAKLCQENGIVFSLGSWQQKAWTDNQDNLIENLPDTDEGFTQYCALGVKTLLEKCPGMGALQFRVNLEAGVSNNNAKPRPTETIIQNLQGAANVGTASAARAGNVAGAANAAGSTNPGAAAAAEPVRRANTHSAFWNTIVDSIASVGRPIKLDLRAKGVTTEMVEHAMASGLDVSIPTKYWCEHAALPYHISKLRTEEMRHVLNENSSRRYSYGDMLKKPHYYDVIYRLWTYGSINLFLWADPDYCSRFSKSMSMGEASGFEVNSPLALKGGMEVYADKAWNIHKDNAIKTYRWEDERYWAFYLAFGRYGYNSDTSREVISREFKHRFGKDGEAILKTYEYSSRVMPLITTIHFPVHPSLHNWPELFAGAALFTENNFDTFYKKVNYAISLPSDEELFYSIADFAEDELAGTLKPRYSPLVFRNYLYELAHNIRASLEAAGCGETALSGSGAGAGPASGANAVGAGGAGAGDAASTGGAASASNAAGASAASISAAEKLAMWVDFSMVALIAEFHSWKIAAAYHLYRYGKNNSKEELLNSYKNMLNAGSCWKELSRIGSKYYHDDLQFNAGTGVSRFKNWEFRYEEEVKKDLAQLKSMLEELGEKVQEADEAHVTGKFMPMAEWSNLKINCSLPLKWEKKEDLNVRVDVEGDAPKAVYLNYRHTNHVAGEYIQVPMKNVNGKYEAVIPGEYFVQNYDVIVYISALDDKNRAVIYPGVNHAEHAAPYFVIKTASFPS